MVPFRGELIRDLVSRGHEVFALAPEIPEAVAAQLSSLGARPHEVAISNTSVGPLGFIRTYGELTRALTEIAPTTLIPYTIAPVTIGSLAASRAGVKNIIPLITGLGYAFGEGKGLKRRAVRFAATILYGLALRRSSVVIFQNPDDQKYFRTARILPDDKPSIVVNGSGVNLAEFAPQPMPSRPVFLMIARLIREKGVLEYAEAAKQLKARHPDARFLLAGWLDASPDGISQAELRQLIVDGVEYLGKLSDVRQALAEASVFVLPSRYREGIPRSILEAMAMGRPIVTSDSPGCRETVLPGENGFLVRPGDVRELTEAMESFIIDPSLAASMGQRSRSLAEARFDVRKVNAEIIEAAKL